MEPDEAGWLDARSILVGGDHLSVEESSWIADCRDRVAILDYLGPGDLSLARSPFTYAVGVPWAHGAGCNIWLNHNLKEA